MGSITVLVADNQFLFADALARCLGTLPDLEVLPDRPQEATRALEVVEADKPDVALLDYWLAGMTGPALIRVLSSRVPRTRLVHVSWFHGAPHIQASLDAGAAAFLPKGVGVDQVAEVVRRVHAGQTRALAEKVGGLVQKVNRRAADVDGQWERLTELTPRELEVLRLLADGLSVQDVCEALTVTEATVRSHIHHVLTKTGTRNQMEAVALAREHGVLA